ncbi:MAG: cytochrome c [Ardenticatenales bacterium]|nr:cytochrome c [Ardenticatenales bacterium]MCB9171746.1 cytochrome c [Ardenticatenales bacterium]
MNRKMIASLLALLLLVGCAVGNNDASTENDGMNASAMGAMGMGRDGMGARHHATVPEAYVSLSNPIAPDEESLARGGALYAENCASCHGDGGMGDGPAAAALDPAAAPVAHTSQMMSDSYLFWRISEGGAQFDSAMPAWGESLDEQARWDLINYMRALGRGEVAPSSDLGGSAYEPGMEQAARQAMVEQAVAQALISAEEGESFLTVHSAIDDFMTSRADQLPAGSHDDQIAAALATLVETGALTQAQVDGFNDIHDRLLNSGLMQ